MLLSNVARQHKYERPLLSICFVSKLSFIIMYSFHLMLLNPLNARNFLENEQFRQKNFSSANIGARFRGASPFFNMLYLKYLSIFV